jgi:hypothetical protein
VRLYCITAAALSALLMAVAVFIGNLSHSEYKSQMRKRKMAKIEQIIFDDTSTASSAGVSEDSDVQLV